MTQYPHCSLIALFGQGCVALRAEPVKLGGTGSAVGAAGSPAAAIAANLIASCDVRVCLAQDVAPLAMTRDAIGLTGPECAHIASWGAAHIGHALWKIGRHHSAAVRLELTAAEREWFYTNQRMSA